MVRADSSNTTKSIWTRPARCRSQAKADQGAWQLQSADRVSAVESGLVKPLHLRHRYALVVGKRTVVRQAGPSTMAGLKTGRRFDISPRAEAVQAARHVSRVANAVVH